MPTNNELTSILLSLPRELQSAIIEKMPPQTMVGFSQTNQHNYIQVIHNLNYAGACHAGVLQYVQKYAASSLQGRIIAGLSNGTASHPIAQRIGVVDAIVGATLAMRNQLDRARTIVSILPNLAALENNPGARLEYFDRLRRNARAMQEPAARALALGGLATDLHLIGDPLVRLERFNEFKNAFGFINDAEAQVRIHHGLAVGFRRPVQALWRTQRPGAEYPR
jgi:hypothetical protein